MKTILSIDGGGIKGLIPAIILSEIERRIGAPLAERADLIAGTSTGGIIGMALSRWEGGSPMYSAADVVGMYRSLGWQAFSRPRWPPLRLVAPKYDGAGLQSVLKEKFGAARLSGAETRLMVTAYDTASARAIMLKSWRENTADWLMWEAAYGTSAVPTYFPPLCAHGHSLIDGGVGAADPSVCALAEASRLWPGEETYVISLGTGARDDRASCERVRKWGLVAWAQRIPGILIDGPADYTQYQLRRFLPDDRYVRLDIEIEPGVAMDDPSEANLDRLTRYAERIIAEQPELVDKAAEVLNSTC